MKRVRPSKSQPFITWTGSDEKGFIRSGTRMATKYMQVSLKLFDIDILQINQKS
jgi:hypothetical protein